MDYYDKLKSRTSNHRRLSGLHSLLAPKPRYGDKKPIGRRKEFKVLAPLLCSRDRPAPPGHFRAKEVPARYDARAGCLSERTTMTTNATSGQEPDASDANQQPTSEADSKSHETVHTAGDWMLLVTSEGYVEAREDKGPYEGARYFTTRSKTWAPRGADYRYGKSIEKVLARYAHETRFERDPNDGEHGAALRRGIINALQSVAPTTFPGDTDRQPVGVVHVNAPTGPSTYIVSEDGTDTGTYATFYSFEDASESATEAGR
jgi:hypothetical protein